MLEVVNTHTGKIYVDRERRLEFLTVGDYGNAKHLSLLRCIHGYYRATFGRNAQ